MKAFTDSIARLIANIILSKDVRYLALRTIYELIVIIQQWFRVNKSYKSIYLIHGHPASHKALAVIRSDKKAIDRI